MFYDFQNGDVIFTDQSFSLLSFWIKLLQGDFQWSHVCQYFDGKIYTTGAGGPLLYKFGTVDPKEYLKDKNFAVLRYDTLSPIQQQEMKEKAESLIGNRYPVEKMIALAIRGKTTGGVVKKLGFKANPNPKNSFCSGSVAMVFKAAGIKLNPESEKMEPDAYSPEAIFDDKNLKQIFTTK